MPTAATVEVPNPFDDGASLAQERAEFLDYLTFARGLSQHTVRAYAGDVAQFVAWADRQGMDALSASRTDLRRYLASRSQQGAAHTTMSRELSSIRAFFAWLVRQEKVTSNPADSLSSPKIGRHLPAVIDSSDMDRLLSVSDLGTPLGQRDQAMLELSYACGCRIAELVALDLGDVDQGRAQVILFGKGGKTRIVPLYKAALDAVAAYVRDARPVLAARRKGPDDGRKSERALFLTAHGLRMSTDDARKRFYKLARAAGLRADASPHAMRHTFATDVLAGGADLRSVQEMLGHASLSTTQIYTHLTPERLQEAARQAHPRGE